MDKYIIAIYLRLSIEDRKVESMSIESQRILLRKFAETLGIDNIEIVEYVDNGYTGTNFERPAVQQLLDDVRAFNINCIIVKDFSRFGRNSIEVGYFTQQVFPLFNVRFISVSDGFDSENHKGDTGGMAVTFKYLVNEYYSRDLSMKTKTSKYMKMRKGEYKHGVYCYGYKRGEQGEMVINEETADIVRLIFTLSSEGKTTTDIIRELYKREIPTPAQYKAQQGKKYKYNVADCKYWDKAQICRMLHDEQYLGTFVMCKQTVQEVGSKKNVKRDESEWIKIPNHHQAIISQELFDKVQNTMRTCRHYVRNTYTYPLKGKVICGCCKHLLHREMTKRIKYVCWYTRHDKTEPCYKQTIYEEDLHKVLFDIISKQAEILLNIDSVADLDKIKLQTAQTIETKKRIEQCQKAMQNLYEQLLTKEITLDEYKSLKENHDADMQKFQKQYESSYQSVEQAKIDSQAKSQLIQIARDVKKENTLTQALSDTLIDKVLVYPDNRIEIVWKIQDFCMDMEAVKIS